MMSLMMANPIAHARASGTSKSAADPTPPPHAEACGLAGVEAAPGGGDKRVLPVVDLRQFRDPSTRDAFVSEIRDAFSQHGFFYLVGHGVARNARAEAMRAARAFFALPSSQKHIVDSSLSPHVRGYSRLGRERTVGIVDIREVWEMGPDAAPLPADKLAECPPFMRLQGPNVWPSHPPDFEPAVGRMFRQLGEVCEELLRGVAVALGQAPQYFDQVGYFADKNTAMKLKCCSYPSSTAAAEADAENVERGSLGVGPHKDYGFLAVIDQSEPGLQILDRLGRWHSVPLFADALVVNGGELLELASGGAFMAATHRVAVTQAQASRPRLSIGFFYNPSFHAIVKPISTLPPSMVQAAAANREIRTAAAAAGEGRDLYGETPRPYGYNALRGYLRSLPHIFERHHPDLVSQSRL
eukprot:SAG31_NODE_110_length_24476_cov_9.909654_9_plen_412_part_00